MPRIPDPNEDRIARLERLVDDLLKNSNQERTSVSYGLFQFIGGKLQGLAEAVFEWVGTFNLTGTLTAIGRSIFRGPVEITGEDGTLDVTAETILRSLTKVLGDLRVEEDGKIYIGTAMVFDPTVESGAIVFQNGAQVFTNGDTIQVYLGNGVVSISNTEAKLQLGGTAIVVDEDGIHFYGPVIAHNLPTIDEDANAVADDDGRLGKTAD
jgi:hypothetical protein